MSRHSMEVGGQSGFSLLETLIALVILSVGLLALGLLQIGAMKGNENSIDRTNAVNIAQSLLDDLKKRSLDDDLLKDLGDNGNNLDDGRSIFGGSPDPESADFSFGQVTTADGQAFTVFWNVDENAPFAGAKTVRLFVYWNDQEYGLSRVIMTTVLGGMY